MKEASDKYDQGKGFSFYFMFILLALAGQLCWNMENQWFNTYLYATITKDSNYVTAMVILSATLTCISTFIFGALSDRLGKRKLFTGWGFIVWGIATIGVGLCQYIIDPNNKTTTAVAIAATMVVLMDGIMSFIGSIAYDSSYNAWVNDHTNDGNKGVIGLVLGIMPVIGTILGTVIGGLIIDSNGGDNYIALFLTMGGLVICCGIACLVFAKDKKYLLPNREGSFWNQVVTPFKFRSLSKIENFKEMLYASILAAVYFTSFNFYFAHIANWAIYNLGFSAGDFGLLEGAGMIIGIILAIPCMGLISKEKTPVVALLGLVTSFVGLMIIYLFVKDASAVDAVNIFSAKNIPLVLAVVFFGFGEILITMACMMWVRGLFPEANRGQFEGFRCVFFTWVPMLIGTLCGNLIIKAIGTAGVDEIGMSIDIPPVELFFYASFVVLLAFIPLVFAWRAHDKRVKAKKKEEENQPNP